MSNRSEYVKSWRRRTKDKIVQSMGGKCGICGYCKCQESLQLHHLDIMKKEFGIGQIMGHPVSWDRIKEELKKCVMLCSNCHTEFHNGKCIIPLDIQGFDENLIKNKNADLNNYEYDLCPICNKPKRKDLMTCSRRCAAQKTWSVKWNTIDLDKMVREGKSLNEIGNELGVTYQAVTKRIKKHHPDLVPLICYKKISKKVICRQCPNPIHIRSKTGLCSVCYNISKRKTIRPTKEILEEKLKSQSWLSLAREYGVSDNAVRKWAKSYGIIV